MKVAIVGSSGYIAGFLLRRFKNDSNIESVLKIDQTNDADSQMNLLNPEIYDYSILENIDYVIFTAAISGPDKCATDYDFCWKVNVVGTSYFIEQALKKGCRVLFFSSDAVYGDIKGQIYDENSATLAGTPYGKMKKTIEDRFKHCAEFKAIRLSYVVSAKDRFVSYCLSCIQDGKIADVFHPFYRNCITVTDVVDVVHWLLHNWDTYTPFALNVAGRELVSRVRIADEINRKFDNALKYTISQPGGDFYKNRPSVTQMRSLYLAKLNIIDDNSFTEKIQKELKEIKL